MTVDPAVGADRADLAMTAWDEAFYRPRWIGAQYRSQMGAGPDSFWRQAEMLEVVEDAYERTGGMMYKRMIGRLCTRFMWRFGKDWTKHRFNDDVMWMVIASLRAYQITGKGACRDVAKRNFDAVWARGWDDTFGGGLWWTTDRHEKNACVNAPAAIAACLLSRALGDATYFSKAERLYAWTQARLLDPQTGAVLDHVGWTKDDEATAYVNRVTWTYNAGTFIGAADELYRETRAGAYYDDAMKALTRARDALTKDGILQSEGSGGDGGGFKGIFVRWATAFTRNNRIGDFDDWFTQNAVTAWSHRNDRGLMGEDWSSATAADGLYAFDCSSAVALLQAVTR